MLALLTACVGGETEKPEATTPEPVIPVIVGVKSGIVVYEDDPEELLNSLLYDGVKTEGGEPLEVKIKFISKADGTEVTELTAGEYNLRYYCDDEKVEAVKSSLVIKPKDETAPVIEGVTDKIVEINTTVAYREGVTVTDNDDKNVQLEIDSSQVDLSTIGEYTVTYSATDKRGNSASVTVKVTVVNPPDEGVTGEKDVCTKEELDKLCADLLSKLINDGMTERQKAEAIYNHVYKIKYVHTNSQLSWVSNAYVGLTTGRGDCYNYSAASKALLTAAGIPNYDIKRVGGTSEHSWNIVYIDGAWYHFDACPTNKKYPFRCFLKTDSEVKKYSDSRSDKPNYYGYDKESCPYDVVD